MEFKGTNETWFRSGTEIVSMPSQVKIAKVSGRTYEEAIANSKLIENAKEFLFMLEDIIENHYVDSDIVVNEIKELINKTKV